MMKMGGPWSFNEPLRTELGPNGLKLENKTTHSTAGRRDRTDVAAFGISAFL